MRKGRIRPQEGRKQGFALSLSLRTMLSLLLCGPQVPHPSCLPDFSESQSLIHSARTQSPNDSSCPKFTRLFSTHAQHQPEISFWFLVPIPQKGTHYLRRTFCPSPQKPLIVLWPAHTQATPGYHGLIDCDRRSRAPAPYPRGQATGEQKSPWYSPQETVSKCHLFPQSGEQITWFLETISPVFSLWSLQFQSRASSLPQVLQISQALVCRLHERPGIWRPDRHAATRSFHSPHNNVSQRRWKGKPQSRKRYAQCRHPRIFCN